LIDLILGQTKESEIKKRIQTSEYIEEKAIK
jgi:hypothetical protein